MRLGLMAPLAVLLISSLALFVIGLGASGAAEVVRYPDMTPVLGATLASVPAIVFAAWGSLRLWQLTYRPYRIRIRHFGIGVAAIASAIAMIAAYAALVGDPEHYKGEFNPVTQEWDPRVESATTYLFLIFGVATTFPMGVLGAVAKLFYVDAIEPAKLERPEGLDPMGEIMATQ